MNVLSMSTNIILIAGVNVLLYWRTLSFGLVVDDIQRHHQREKGQLDAGNWFNRLALKLRGGATFRNLKADHALTVGINALIAVLIYLAFGASPASLLGALLYSTNPVNHQTSVWLNGRRYAVNIILVLLMILFAPVGVLAYCLTPFFQINALLSPLWFVLDGRWPWLVLIVPAGILVGWKYLTGTFKARKVCNFEGMETGKIKFDKAIIFTKTIGFYFWHSLLPNKLTMLYPTLYRFGLTYKTNQAGYKLDLDFYKGLVTLYLLGFLISIPGTGKFFAMWIILNLQWGNIYTITHTLADRYQSLPNVFLMMGIASLILTFPLTWAACVSALLVGIYWARLQIAFGQYVDLGQFYLYQLHHFPGMVTLRYTMAGDAINRGDMGAAMAHIREGIRFEPEDHNLHVLAALVFFKMKNLPAAHNYVTKARAYPYAYRDPAAEKLLRELEDKIKIGVR